MLHLFLAAVEWALPTEHIRRNSLDKIFVFRGHSPRYDLKYGGLNLNQDKATKPQTVQIVRQSNAVLV